MPAKSQAQREFLYAHFGSEWVHAHHFANKGKLPMYVDRHAPRKRKPRSV